MKPTKADPWRGAGWGGAGRPCTPCLGSSRTAPLSPAHYRITERSSRIVGRLTVTGSRRRLQVGAAQGAGAPRTAERAPGQRQKRPRHQIERPLPRQPRQPFIVASVRSVASVHSLALGTALSCREAGGADPRTHATAGGHRRDGRRPSRGSRLAARVADRYGATRRCQRPSRPGPARPAKPRKPLTSPTGPLYRWTVDTCIGAIPPMSPFDMTPSQESLGARQGSCRPERTRHWSAGTSPRRHRDPVRRPPLSFPGTTPPPAASSSRIHPLPGCASRPPPGRPADPEKGRHARGAVGRAAAASRCSDTRHAAATWSRGERARYSTSEVGHRQESRRRQGQGPRPPRHRAARCVQPRSWTRRRLQSAQLLRCTRRGAAGRGELAPRDRES